MVLTASNRHLIACIASVLLLWCQGAAAALVCVPPTGPAGGSSSLEQCHETAHPADHAPGNVQPHGCSAQYASAGAVKIDVPQAADLPALEVESDWLPVPARDNWLAAAPPARATPPPLTILYCCLRN